MRLLVRDSNGKRSWSATLVVWVMILDTTAMTLQYFGFAIEPIISLLTALTVGVIVKFMTREITTKILASKNGNESAGQK